MFTAGDYFLPKYGVRNNAYKQQLADTEIRMEAWFEKG